MPFTLGDVQLGKHRINKVVFAIAPKPKKMKADGIIGMDFLKHYRFEIDRVARTLTLQR